MFKCQLCGRLSGPRVPESRVVIETRHKVYPYRKQANVYWFDGDKIKRDDPGGEGQEIVKEISVCPGCAEKH